MNMRAENGMPLGWRPGPADDRDWPITDELEERMGASRARQHGSRNWFVSTTLKQWVGSCVGHGAIQVYNASPKTHKLTDDDAMRVYDLAQRKYDPWDDTPPEEGTSVRAGAQAMRELGYWSRYVMGYNHGELSISIEELARFILNVGPVMMGISWKEGYNRPTAKKHFYLQDEGQDQGGHNFKVDAVTFTGNPDRDWFRMHQSWGTPWGYKAYNHGGFARISWSHMERILADESTTVCSPVEA